LAKSGPSPNENVSKSCQSMGKRLTLIFDCVNANEMDRPHHVRSARGGITDIAAFPFRANRRNGPEFRSGDLSLTKVDMDDQLALGGMPGNVTFTGPVFRKHNAAGGEPANVAIARLEFHLAGEPDHELATRRVVPIHHSHSDRHSADVAAGCRKRFRQTQRRMAVEEGSRHQRDVDLFHVRFALGIRVDTQIRHAFVGGAGGISDGLYCVAHGFLLAVIG